MNTEQNILKEFLCKVCQKYPENNCDTCWKLRKGYQLAQKENQEAIDDFVKKYELLEEAFYDYRKETTEKVEKLKEYFNCSPLECEKIDKIFGDTETKQKTNLQ